MSDKADKRDELERQVKSLRPGALPPNVANGSVTGVFQLAFEQLEELARIAARSVPPKRVLTAAERLLQESERTLELTRRLSNPPPAKPT